MVCKSNFTWAADFIYNGLYDGLGYNSCDILAKHGHGTNFTIGITGNGDRLYASNAVGFTLYSTPIEKCIWHNVIVTKDEIDSRVRLFVDGKLMSSGILEKISGGIYPTIGIDANGRCNLIGYISDIFVDDSCLYRTESDIKDTKCIFKHNHDFYGAIEE